MRPRTRPKVMRRLTKVKRRQRVILEEIKDLRREEGAMVTMASMGTEPLGEVNQRKRVDLRCLMVLMKPVRGYDYF
jgi:hypothetical protein